MCGIFGQIANKKIDKESFDKIVNHSEQRGVDSSGILYFSDAKYKIAKADFKIKKLLSKTKIYDCKLAFGHSRLITNGLSDNQPVIRGNICVIHNGIIVNEDQVWKKLSVARRYQIDSELIVAIAEECLAKGNTLEDIPSKVLDLCRGSISCALALPAYGKLLLFSNNGSLYHGKINDDIYFASEKFALSEIACEHIEQIKNTTVILDIPQCDKLFEVNDSHSRVENLIPKLQCNITEEKLL